MNCKIKNLHCILKLSVVSSVECRKTVQLNPYRRDLKTLQQEPPLEASQDKTRNEIDVSELWIEQPLDHFSEQPHSRTWKMRYMHNDKYYQPGGPLFIFVGGEWEISKAYLVDGHVHDMAQQHAGMLYYTEHRHYGHSWPHNNASLEEFKYLNMRQAVADLAYFVQHEKATNISLSKAKVILAGGSYSGSMVAAFTLLYPEIATAAWATSAPLEARLDFYEYMEQMGAAIRQMGGPRCYARIETGMNGLAKLLSTVKGSRKFLKLFRICDDFNPTDNYDVATFFNGIGNHFAAVVQSSSSYIKPTCNYLMQLDADDFEAFTKYLNAIFWPESKSENDWCLDFSYQSMKLIFTEPQSSTRSWFYQTCNEFGWFTATENSVSHPFARLVPLRYFERLCSELFGTDFTLQKMSLAVQRTNTIFTGNTQAYANIFFTHGQLDPWRAVGGVQADNCNYIVIPGHAHTEDLGSLNVNDSVHLNVAKLKVSAFLSRQLWHSKS